MTADTPHILLINPWIHDFAAYDFWARPMGLLMLAAILRDHGYQVSYCDCLDRFHPRAPASTLRARHGRGPYLKSPLPLPTALGDVPRRFSRYGIKPDWLREDLKGLPPPDLILVTSLMTYWYPGIRETIGVLKDIFPAVPVWLGGIYATLCPTHARNHSGADQVFTGGVDASLMDRIGGVTGFSVTPKYALDHLQGLPWPAHDLQRKLPFIPLLTSIGCPFGCAYCASRFLNPTCQRREPVSVLEEVLYWQKSYGIADFVFYDDALLLEAETHVIPFLEAVIGADLKLRFHTPNAIHIRSLSLPLTRLMKRAGFHTLRLGLETTVFGKRGALDQKVTESEFMQAVVSLKAAGFGADQVGAYLLAGLPEQPMAAVEAAARLVRRAGITPIPAYYSPIPHTPLWPKAVASSRYALADDPLFANNAILPCRKAPFDWQVISRLKRVAMG